MNLTRPTLEKLGSQSAVITAIEDDINKGDARSLLSELLILGLWRTVLDEQDPQLEKTGGEAVQRLLASGVSYDDLVDVVRETQVETIYSIAQLIDWPAEGIDLDDALELQISVNFLNMNGHSLPIHELHSCLMERDPTGRHGEPRSLEMRQLQKFSEESRNEIQELIRNKNFSAAALIWKKQAGGDLKNCLAAVQSLHGKIGIA